jgi:regulator of sirC expression with transglutaminase-like and TPR domain
MSVPLNFKVPTALEYFAALVAEDSGFATLEAAVAIAQDDYPELDPQEVLGQIDALAARLKRRLPTDAGSLQSLRALNRFFFQELGFAGNLNDYHDPDNSYLHRVLQTRRGIPISLAILYVELATQIGLTARGVAFPGHFLVKLRLPQGEVIIDPFNGQSLSREQLEERLDPYRQGRGLVGDFEVPLGLFLQAASGRDVIARMLGNLKEIHRGARDPRRLLAVHDRLVLLLPEAWEEQRDRGLTLAGLGQSHAAAADLAAYLMHVPDADDAPGLRLRLAELQGSSRPLLH